MRTVSMLVAILGFSGLAVGAEPVPSPPPVVKIKVPAAALEALKGHGQWVFLTPVANPIKSVSDLNAPAQFAYFDSNVAVMAGVLKFLEAAGASPEGVVDLGGNQEVFGPKTEKDRIRLFIADGPTEAARIKGGVKVEFVADATSPRSK